MGHFLLSWLLSWLLFWFLIFPNPLSYSDDPKACVHQIVTAPEAAVLRIERELDSVLRWVHEICDQDVNCRALHLAALPGEAVPAMVRPDTVWGRALKLPRRLFLGSLFVGSGIGSGVGSYMISQCLGAGNGIATVVGATFSSIACGYLSHLGEPFYGKLAPEIERLAFVIYNPNSSDSWGQINRRLHARDRFTIQQMFYQVLTLRDHLKEAGRSVSQENYDSAARHYATALLASTGYFKGLHLYHPLTIGEVRSWLPPLNQLSPEQKARLILAVCQKMNQLPDEEVPEGSTREELVRFAYGVVLRWLVETKPG